MMYYSRIQRPQEFMSKSSNEIVENLGKFFQKLSQGKKVAFALCLALIFTAILFMSDYTDRFDRLFQDLSQKNLARFIPCSEELAIVALDTETLDGIKERWPWPRTRFADLLDVINSFEPRVIVFDVVFQHTELSDAGLGDEALARAMARAGNVALVGFIEEIVTDAGKQKRQYRSLKKFRDAAFCDGYIHSFIDPDSKIRTFSISDAKSGEDGCLLKIARQTGKTAEAIKAQNHLPEKSQIVFSKKNGGIPLYRGLDLIERKIAGDFLKDKIVVVGATAQVLHDYHETCMGLMSGPEILASSLDTIITRRTSAPENGILIRFTLMLLGVTISLLMALRSRFKHELVSISVYLALMFILYHLLTMFLVFMPLSCFFITWAFVAISYNFIRRFIEMIEQQIANAEAARAGEIQAELFPEKFILTDSYSIRGICLPCDATGGDFFDYFELEDKNIIFVLGDVAGHGFSAAMLTVMAKTTIQLLRNKRMASPETIVATLNELLFELVKKKKFMTLAAGHVNTETHQLNLVQAGHLPPLIISADGKLEEMKRPGFPLGVVSKLPIKTITCELQPGDSLVLYTDGIVEALDWKDKQYTFPAWYEFLQNKLSAFTDDSNMEELLTGVNQHKGSRRFDDDVTYVIVKRRQRGITL